MSRWVTGYVASSFADPPDMAAFRRCKAQGKTDKQCFLVGDNGIGTPLLGGIDTTSQTVPMCAMHQEDWMVNFGNPPSRHIEVRIGRKIVRCLLADTLGPKSAKIYRGESRIDLNPGAVLAFGLRWPLKVRDVAWRWA